MNGVVTGLVTVVAVLLMVPGLATVTHLAVLAVGSMRYRDELPDVAVPRHRFLVVVPAHDEESVIGVTLAALRSDLRDGDRIMVVDDRSTDRTADIAASFGAIVVRRGPGEVPGRAAARQTAFEHARRLDWDALVMIDADSVVEPGFLDACDRMLATSAGALQARSEAAVGRRLVDQAALVSFAIQGVLLQRGRDHWGLLVRLRGTGMVLRRDLLDRFEFRAPASEDLVYSLDLCRAGVRIRHVEAARLRSQNAGSWRVAGEQKLRYEAGRMAAAREFVRPLLALRNRAGLEAAWFLAAPPVATAAAMVVVAGSSAWAVGSGWLVSVAVVALAVLTAVVLVAVVEARAGARAVLAAAAMPAYLVWKSFVQVRAALAVRSGRTVFGPTQRRRV